jgi:amino acid adenylation domain-containing protein
MSMVQSIRLSPQQKHLWQLRQVDANGMYNAACAVQIEGSLRSDVLRDSIEQVILRHEALRTSFEILPGMIIPVQIIKDGAAFSSSEIDLRGSDPLTQQSKLDYLFDQMRCAPLALLSNSSLSTTLVRLSDCSQVLLIALPAFCADGKSLVNLAYEIIRSCASNNSDLESAPAQYGDISEEFNDLLDSQESQDGRLYWRQQDFSPISIIRLPFESRIDGRRDFAPRFVSRYVEQLIVNKIVITCEQLVTSPASFLLAAWQVLLSRLAAQPDLVIGVGCDGRDYEGLDKALGLFARTVPVRSHLEESVTFADFLGRTDRSIWDLNEWQDYFSLESLRELLADKPESRFLPYSFEFVEPPAAFQTSTLACSIRNQYVLVDRFKLRLRCVPQHNQISLEFHYDPAVFVSTDIDSLADQFITLVGHAGETPDAAIVDLGHIPTRELDRLLVAFNRTGAIRAEDKCVHTLFEEQVERTPDRLAVSSRDHQFTFSMINALANRLAHRLKAAGVGPETPVCLCLQRGPQMIVGVLGILKAGGTYIPYDPTHPKERLSAILSEAGVRYVVTQEELLSSLPDGRLNVICVDQSSETPESNPACSVTPDNLAYVIYTSGSTGRPKGVMVQHRSAVNLFAALSGEIYSGHSEHLCVGLNAPLTFDASIKQLLQLLQGHSIHIFPEEIRSDPERFLSYVRRHNIAAFDCTPYQVRSLIEAGLLDESDASPEIILIGGEALDEQTWDRLCQSSRINSFNVYGPTECTVDATACNLNTASDQVTIGCPIANVKVYILDDYLRPVPVGITGQIYIGGAGVARGYLAQPSQTAERFIPDQFSGQPGGRLYKTGDLGCHIADGRIKFLGRADHQVKLRGYRIEPGEIEAVLDKIDLVARSAVALKQAATQGAFQLVAYVVPKSHVDSPEVDGDETAFFQAELRGRLRQALPEYMIPSAFVLLPRLPVTDNGKVDHNALPDLQPGVKRLLIDYYPPRNQIEKTIAAIWQEELKLDKVGIHDNFFDLGGHSLLMARVYYRLQEEFGNKLSMVEMFRSPTVGTLAQFLDGGDGDGADLEQIETLVQNQKMARARQRQIAGKNRRGQIL